MVRRARDIRCDIVPGFDRQASFPIIEREHRAVREGVGILDMSLMAKFRVQGPDAAAVLGRLSANDVTREVGRLVYTQWLNPAGGIDADLTVTRLSEDDFLVVASDLIHRRVAPMIRRECRDDETVIVTDVTSGYTLLTVQGPLSRELLSRLTDADLSNDAFPYLTSRPIHVDYAPVIASRVTYVGELGWELYVPTEYGLGTYDRLLEVGADLGVRPVGMAAMSGLRLEKGYRDMGVDIDNTDNPLEAGLGFAVAWDKPGGFVGRDALLDVPQPGAPRAGALSASPSRSRRPTCTATSRCCSTATGSATSGWRPSGTRSGRPWDWRRSRTRAASTPSGSMTASSRSVPPRATCPRWSRRSPSTTLAGPGSSTSEQPSSS